MIDGASLEFVSASLPMLGRERLNAAGDQEFRYPAAPRSDRFWRSGGAGDVAEQISGPSVKRGLQGWTADACCSGFCQEGRDRGFAAGNCQRRRRAITFRPKLLKKAGEPQKFLLRTFRRNSRRFTGRKICTGVRRQSVLCGRCAGWWPCSMAKWLRWSSTESRQARSRAATECYPKAACGYPAPAMRTSMRCARLKSWAVKSESSGFAKRWMARLAVFPGRDGAKTSLCSIRW